MAFIDCFSTGYCTEPSDDLESVLVIMVIRVVRRPAKSLNAPS